MSLEPWYAAFFFFFFKIPEVEKRGAGRREWAHRNSEHWCKFPYVKAPALTPWLACCQTRPKISSHLYIFIFFKQAHILKSPTIRETFISDSALFQALLWRLKKRKRTLMYVSTKTVYKAEDWTRHELSDIFITSFQSWVGRGDLPLTADAWQKGWRKCQKFYESSAGSCNGDNDHDSFLHPHS